MEYLLGPDKVSAGTGENQCQIEGKTDSKSREKPIPRKSKSRKNENVIKKSNKGFFTVRSVDNLLIILRTWFENSGTMISAE